MSILLEMGKKVHIQGWSEHAKAEKQKQKGGEGICLKVRYPSTLEAERALELTIRSNQLYGKDNRKETRFYFCPECKGYHLTSKKHQY